MYECRECKVEGRTDDANEAIVSVDITESTGSKFIPQFGVQLCGEHIGETARILAENGTLNRIVVHARLK